MIRLVGVVVQDATQIGEAGVAHDRNLVPTVVRADQKNGKARTNIDKLRSDAEFLGSQAKAADIPMVISVARVRVRALEAEG